MSRSPRDVTSLTTLEARIREARREKRWADASEDLERWLLLSRQLSASEIMELPTSAASAGGLVGKFFATKQARRTSFTDEEEKLRQLLPKVQKAIDAEGKKEKRRPERVMFLANVNKHNEHGKVQHRLLALTSAALYNLDSGGKASKRRVPLSAVGSMSANESSGQFVVHIPSECVAGRRPRTASRAPSQPHVCRLRSGLAHLTCALSRRRGARYDYHFSAPNRGYEVEGEIPESPGGGNNLSGRPPIASLIDAFQRAYASSMGGGPTGAMQPCLQLF